MQANSVIWTEVKPTWSSVTVVTGLGEATKPQPTRKVIEVALGGPSIATAVSSVAVVFVDRIALDSQRDLLLSWICRSDWSYRNVACGWLLFLT